MDIPEAIKELKRYETERILLTDLSFRRAVKLGIEALKRIKKCREDDEEIIDLPLPGETEK